MSNSQTLEVADSTGSRLTYLPWRLRKPGTVLDTVVDPIVPTLSHARQIAFPLMTSIWLLIACKTIIGTVSALDTYLTLKYAVSLHSLEQNPIGRWLMDLDRGPASDTDQVAAFITAKFLGTMLVLIAIQGLAYWRVRLATVVAFCVALGQLLLAWYLLYGP